MDDLYCILYSLVVFLSCCKTGDVVVVWQLSQPAFVWEYCAFEDKERRKLTLNRV